MLLLGACVSKRAVNKRRARETRDASGARREPRLGVARGPARWRVRLPRASRSDRARRRRFARRQPRWGTRARRRRRIACGQVPFPFDVTRRARGFVLLRFTSRPSLARPPRRGASDTPAALRGPARPRRASPRRRRRSTAPRPHHRSERARPPRKSRPPPTRRAFSHTPVAERLPSPGSAPRDRCRFPRTARRRALCRPIRRSVDPSAIETTTRRAPFRSASAAPPRRAADSAAARLLRLAPPRLAARRQRARFGGYGRQSARARSVGRHRGSRAPVALDGRVRLGTRHGALRRFRV